jgi:hypothetical protein
MSFDPSGDTIVVCVSVVPADSTSELDHLSLGQNQRNVQCWKEILARAGIAWFIGASDWSANEHKQQRYGPHWSHHFYGFTVTDDVDKLKQRLGEQFPTTDAIPRPVKVQAWDGKGRAIRTWSNPTSSGGSASMIGSGSTRPTAHTDHAGQQTNSRCAHPRSANSSCTWTRLAWTGD